MEMLLNIWNFIVSHWPNFIGGVQAAKLGADSIDSFKKLLPEKLDAKSATQDYLEKSMTILNDQNVKIEDKQWELNTRQELVKSMITLTAIEATYNVARATAFMAFTTAIFHLLLKFLSRTETRQKE